MKKKIKFYKSLLVEVIETLSSICIICYLWCRQTHNGHEADIMYSHCTRLRDYSKTLRKGKQYE